MRLNYDNISPFTGNKSVLSEWDELHGMMHLCMDTGYHTYDKWKVGNEDVEKFEEVSPETVVESKQLVGDQIWYKIVMLTRDVVLYPTEDEWVVTTLKFVEDAKESNSPIRMVFPTEDGIKFQVIDEDKMRTFESEKFEDAIIEFHSLCSQIYSTNEN